MTEATLESIEDMILNELSEEEIVTLWNRYMYEKIYPMDMLDDKLKKLSISDALREIHRDFNICDDYFYSDGFNIYIYSFNDIYKERLSIHLRTLSMSIQLDYKNYLKTIFF